MILMFYNRHVCKEFLLPNFQNADHTVCLKKELFGLQEDMEIFLQNVDGRWELPEGKQYYLKIDNIRQESCVLKGGDIIEMKTDDGVSLHIIVIDSLLQFSVTKKYDITGMKEISLGQNTGNLIQYGFMKLVSAEHATLRRHSDGWYLIDSSSNGVFCSNIRIQGRRKLQFGDHIELFGLHLVFLGNMLAVSTLYGELKVREDILIPVESVIAEDVPLKAKEIQEDFFHRSPRNMPMLHRETVEIEAPPNPKNVKTKPLYLTIGPAFTMAIPMMLGCGFAIFGSRLSGHTSGAFMYTGLIMAVTSALIGVLWAVLNMNYTKKESLEEETQRFNAYSNYLIQLAASLREKYQHNGAAMRQMYPAAKVCLGYNRYSSELWNRNHSHEDFLYQRLGLGEQPFQVDINVPKEKFTLINDSLLEKPQMMKKEFQTLMDVPVGISLLEKRLIGLVGGKEKRGAIQMMHTLVAGITASHSYTDVKLAFIYQEQEKEQQEDWECMRWFPHVWSEDKSTRYMAANELERRDIYFELSNIIRSRSEEAEEPGSKGRSKINRPHYVLFISDPVLLEDEILAKYIYEAKPEFGITAFLMVEELHQLPNACEEVIQNDGYFTGLYNLMDTDHEKKSFTPDRVDRKELASFGQVLANIKLNELESGSEIPGVLDFLEMYGVSSLEELKIEERWRKNRNYNSMRAPIGVKAGNAICNLDIHEKFHGPHGLVAGTTGSGKSETLQTYILSLAVNFSPEDVSFFIIDFKGGGMANLFSDLPHLSGQISNLSGNQVQRAMISIKSENQRRQRLFSEYDVNNINLYTKLYKDNVAPIPIPHLFIIIDEFAELKREEPEFMQELISVAQVGRSLGVHLILATQKPSGTVDDNIWSNSRFRLCLRVQDRKDSNDMLHKPDAAFITQAGRGYLQVGNDEIFEQFQSGYSGALYEERSGKRDAAVSLLTRTGKAELVGGGRRKAMEISGPKKRQTQLEAVIDHVSEIVHHGRYTLPMKLWLPVLESQIYLQDLMDRNIPQDTSYAKDPQTGRWELEAVVGLYDDPRRQTQKPIFVNLSEGGHHAICGSVVSGKSTFLQTMIFSFLCNYSPEALQMYLLDFSSHMLAPFEEAPHVGGVIYDNQEDKLAKFIFMLQKMMDERKAVLKGGNYGEYVRAYGTKFPAILIVIDNLAGFREKTKNQYDDVLLRLAREGVGYGIYMVVTSAGFGMAEIPSRIADNIRTTISLGQADKYKYMEILRVPRLAVLPEADVKGRGLAFVDGEMLEFQTALAVQAEDDFLRSQKLEDYCKKLKEEWDGAVARPIPTIPENPVFDQLCLEPEYGEALKNPALLPMGYRMEDASVYSIRLDRTYCYAITGKSRTGKTNVLKLLISAALGKNGQICVIEEKTSELRKLAIDSESTYITDSEQLFAFFSDLLKEFARRNKKKNMLLEEGMSEEEIFGQMKNERPIFIYVADLSEFFRMVYKPDEGVGNMSGFVENILEKGSLHNIYFIGCLKTEDESTLPSYRAYVSFASYKKGIHLGGNLAGQKLFDFQNVPYAQQTKTMKRGIGYVPDEEEENIGIEVVVPLMKK